MPLTGGSGTVTSVSNPYRNTTNCSSASVTSLKCNKTDIIIQGPGLNYQTSTCASGGPLPITLISFNAKLVNNNNVYLKWITATEIGNRSFTIERSTDSRNWTTVRTVAGALNSSTNIQYEFTDEGLAVGMYYYRLKQTDVSGTVNYSNVIAANINKVNATTDVAVTTNGNQLYFTGLGNYNEWEMAIMNTSGVSIVRSAAMQSNIVQLPATSTGVYVVRLRNKVTNIDKTIKFLKN